MHRSVKPQVLSALGDIALAIGANFIKYLQPVMLTLEQAAGLKIETVCLCCFLKMMCKVKPLS